MSMSSACNKPISLNIPASFNRQPQQEEIRAERLFFFAQLFQCPISSPDNLPDPAGYRMSPTISNVK